MNTRKDIVDSVNKLRKHEQAADQALINAINAISTTITNSSLIEYEFRYKDDVTDPQYFGYEDPTGKWYIMRLTSDSIAEYYASTTSDIDTEWDNRAGFTYTTFRNAF
jgi:hypothetical protein